jgi:hypothetical protein
VRKELLCVRSLLTHVRSLAASIAQLVHPSDAYVNRRFRDELGILVARVVPKKHGLPPSAERSRGGEATRPGGLRCARCATAPLSSKRVTRAG